MELGGQLPKEMGLLFLEHGGKACWVDKKKKKDNQRDISTVITSTTNTITVIGNYCVLGTEQVLYYTASVITLHMTLTLL